MCMIKWSGVNVQMEYSIDLFTKYKYKQIANQIMIICICQRAFAEFVVQVQRI